MQEIYKSLDASDALVLGSPVYMGQMSGQTKIFCDRLFSEIMPKFSPYYKVRSSKRKLILVFTQGNPDANLFRPYFEYVKNMFEILEFDVIDTITITNMREKPACEQPDLPKMLENVGKTLFD
jgi:multimeric flavodoxin WrbA